MQKMLAVAMILLFATLPLQVFATEGVRAVWVEILDENGRSVEIARTGDRVLIQLGLQNNNSSEKTFAYIVQVQDSEGYTVFLNWQSGTLKDNDTPRISWRPSKADSYVIQAFVWSSIDTPTPLSFAVQNSKIYVKSCSGSASCFAGIVTKVTDGDTLRIDDIAIRLSLVNTPERGDAGYSEATVFTEALCPVGSSTLVDEDDGQTAGSYGRIVAKVYCGNRMLNEELLLSGHAGVYAQFCNDSEFAQEAWVAKYC